jgi:Sec-independent protein secretion pathway component TatC
MKPVTCIKRIWKSDKTSSRVLYVAAALAVFIAILILPTDPVTDVLFTLPLIALLGKNYLILALAAAIVGLLGFLVLRKKAKKIRSCR